MSTVFNHHVCGKPARWTPDDTLSHENTDDALACRFDGLDPQQIRTLMDADEIECTCGLTFYDRAGFDGHQDQIIQENGGLSGHWEVGTI